MACISLLAHALLIYQDFIQEKVAILSCISLDQHYFVLKIAQ